MKTQEERMFYSSYLLVKLHQTPFTGIRVLFIIEIFIVVHIPAHLLLIFNRTLKEIQLQHLISLHVIILHYDLDNTSFFFCSKVVSA